MSNFIVGLTGGIGSGKTTIANEFARLGVELIDADVIARQVVDPGSHCLNAIVEKFGDELLLDDQTLNRAQLRTLIFSDEIKKQWLNNLMHPAIRNAMLQQLKEASTPYCILIAPLLFENALERYTNTNLVVDVPELTQIDRTKNRDGVSEEQIKSIIQAQISRAERLNQADDVIDNNLPLEQVQQQIEPLHMKYMAFSKKQT
ncbi:MAG: dephospho-CoA kinase [Alteromonadaceae bacterium]|jgi:dephospho-CoA kinase